MFRGHWPKFRAKVLVKYRYTVMMLLTKDLSRAWARVHAPMHSDTRPCSWITKVELLRWSPPGGPSLRALREEITAVIQICWSLSMVERTWAKLSVRSTMLTATYRNPFVHNTELSLRLKSFVRSLKTVYLYFTKTLARNFGQWPRNAKFTDLARNFNQWPAEILRQKPQDSIPVFY